MLNYHRPATLSEACELLASLGAAALPLAGGTDIVVDIRRGTKRPQHVVSLRDIPELRGIRLEGNILHIGALSTPAEIRNAAVLRTSRPELLEAAEIFGTPQIRNRATLGGNLCTAASCGDLPPLLLAFGSKVVVAHAKFRREIALQDFFKGVRATTLAAGEIVVGVQVPAREAGEGARYETFGQRAAAFITVAGVAAAVKVDQGICRSARVVLSAVAPTPLLVPAAGEKLVGRKLDEETIGAAARVARDAAAPISDIRGSVEHRRNLVEVLTQRALRVAGERANEAAH